jgi:hypothetical protein
VDTVGTRKPGLELSWTLNFERGGKQGRVRAKVKKLEPELGPEHGGRRLRARPPPVNRASRDDEDDDDE